MWVKIGNDYLNLDQIIRVRFTRAFRAGQEELGAEVEALIKGELQVFTRYRGAEASALQALITPLTVNAGGGVAVAESIQAAHVGGALSNTLHDVDLP